MAARLLSISFDRTLLMTRHLMLTEKGFQVTSASDMQELTQALAGSDYDVFILGHSLPPQEKLRVFHLLRAHSQTTPMLEMYKFSPDLDTGYALSSQAHPEDLLNMVREMIDGRRDATG